MAEPYIFRSAHGQFLCSAHARGDLVFVARGMTPRLKSWQLSEVVARLFAQAGLPDKAKQPGAKPPATVPPADRAAKQ